ncbi:MAG: amidase family protein, partial [Planctomycetota bacterium]
GAVIVGKANVPQAMYLHETDNPVYGRTSHPLDPDRGPGGSSGGDAALVAAGVVPLGVGNDLAGSLRQPAHACGIAALMPRFGVLGNGGAVDTLPHVRVVRPRAGFLARGVADLALALAAVTAAPADACPPVRRVGWWDETGPIPPSPAIRRAVAEAVAAVRGAGVELVRLDAAIAAEAAWLHLAILSAHGTADIRRLFAGERPMRSVGRLLRLGGMPRWLRPPLAAVVRLLGRGTEARGLLATGPRDTGGLAALLAAREQVAARFAAAVSGCDAVICPVSALPALRHGSAARLVLAAAPCLLANLLDLAAGAVPVTTVGSAEETGRPWSVDPVLRAAARADQRSRGLPVGVQVVATPGGGEGTVLEVMRLIERQADGVTSAAS